MLLTLAGLRAGYVTRYLNEPLAWGLTPESMQTFFVQRQCWAKGAMQKPAVRPDEMGEAEAAPKAKLAPAERSILPVRMGTDDARINA
ncbi:MAG: hypothetical protein ACK5SX_14110 [Sandaracinobacter sp.]